MIMTVGDEALATGFYDSCVPRQFARALMSVEADVRNLHGDPAAAWSRPGLWDALRTMHERYLASGYFAEDRPRFLNYYAGCAWRCRAFTDAHRILDMLGADADPKLIKAWFGISLDAMRADVSAGESAKKQPDAPAAAAPAGAAAGTPKPSAGDDDVPRM